MFPRGVESKVEQYLKKNGGSPGRAATATQQGMIPRHLHRGAAALKCDNNGIHIGRRALRQTQLDGRSHAIQGEYPSEVGRAGEVIRDASQQR
jgi:hypothetical protein